MTSQWQIDILTEVQNLSVSKSSISSFLERLLSELHTEPIAPCVRHLSVVMSDDAKLQELNREYRGKDKPTDVLSFSQLEEHSAEYQTDPGASVPSLSLGDIVISVETAQRQAKQFGVSLEEELSRLLVHGLLHLFGYEHEGVAQEVADTMFQKQDELLNKIQIQG